MSAPMDEQVSAYDKIMPRMRDEPCAYKRAIYRDGYSAALAAMPTPDAAEVRNAALRDAATAMFSLDGWTYDGQLIAHEAILSLIDQSAPASVSDIAKGYENPSRPLGGQPAPAHVSVGEAARIVEAEIGLGAVLRKVHGDQAHRIMPHIWPLLQNYMELVVERPALAGDQP